MFPVMNPPHVGGARAFNDLYEGSQDLGRPASVAGVKRPVTDDDSLALDEKVAKLGTEQQQGASGDASSVGEDKRNARKIYVGNLPPNITERPINDYFSQFGEVCDCKVIRDRTTGISRGFAFVTFLCETMAEAALNFPQSSGKQHVIQARPIRVSTVQKSASTEATKNGTYKPTSGGGYQFLEELVMPSQNRIYVGPLDETIVGADLTQQFSQFGTILGVSRLKASETHSKKSCYGFIDFKESIAVRRAFGSKIFVKGKHVKVSLSRFAMETILNPSVIFFYDAHLHIDELNLERHFSIYGKVYRCAHLTEPNGLNKLYGFVDFLSSEAVSRAIAEKTHLLYPGQYVKVSKMLPLQYLFDMFAIGDQQGNEIIRKLDRVVPQEGSWGPNRETLTSAEAPVSTTKVRIPASMVGKVIGERGKTIAEISRDSKTKINIPKVDDDSPSVIISVTGTKENIRTAQYLMQRVIKG